MQKQKKGLGLDHILWDFLKTKGKCKVGKLICRNELETELTIANCSKISNNDFERKKGYLNNILYRRRNIGKNKR